MSSDSNTPFNRQVRVNQIFLVKPQVLQVKAEVINIGQISWNRDPLKDRRSTFRLGYRLVCHQRNFFPVEKILPLGAELVLSGESVAVEWDIPLPQASELFKLEIDVISIGEDNLATWFSSLGLLPATVEMKTPHIAEKALAYRSSFSDVTIKRVSSSFVMISGFIQNRGSETWNAASARTSDFFLGIRCYSSTSLDLAIWEGRGHVEKSPLEPGEESRFSAMIATEHLKGGAILKLCMLREKHFWFDDFSASACLVDLSGIHQGSADNIKTRINYQASIRPRECILAEGFLIQVSGVLANIGAFPWNPTGHNRSQPIAVGIRIMSPDSPKTIRESRAALPSRPVLPGESLPFAVTLSTLALPPGRYIVLVDMVYESVFWFSQQGSDAIELGLEIPVRQSLPAGKRRECNFIMPTEAGKSRVLFISPTLPLYDRQAGGKRLFYLLQIMKKLGFTVDFFYDSPGEVLDPERYIKRLESVGIIARQEALIHLATIPPDCYDTCILAWFDCAELYMPIIRTVLPRAKVIIDTVDIHWVREQRGVASGELQFSAEELAERKLRESTIYREADLLWVVTETDRQAVIDHDPMIQHQLVPLIYPDAQEKIRDLNQDGILFVGGFRHPPNIAAARRGAQICADFRRQSGKKAPFYIVGDAPPAEIRDLEVPGETEVIGFAEDLEPFYQKSRVTIAPLQSGAGMKGKVCDAALEGIPVITTSIGVEGLYLEDQKEFFLAHSNYEFTEALKQVFSPQTDLKSISHRAYKKIARLTSADSVATTVAAGLVYRPVVIAIVTWNRKEMLRSCLEAVLSQTNYPNYKIAVVSNGCIDGTKEMLREYQERYPRIVDVYLNEENLYFVKPNNFVIREYPNHDVVMMNNDIEVRGRDWLTCLYHGAYSTAFAGAAGGMTLDGEGRVSEAGGAIDINGYGQNIGRGADPATPELQIPRSVDFCSGCLLYLRRDALNHFGDLNEEYHPMYYEDVEWQYRIKGEGFKTVYVPQCVATHYEGSSAGTDITVGMKRFQEINRLKFLASDLLQQALAGSRR